MSLENNQIEYFAPAKPAYYFYRRPLVRIFFTVIDILGFIFFSRQSKISKLGGKILLINLGDAGDLVISEPLVSALADISGVKVDLVCKPDFEKVLLNHPSLGKIFYAELPWLRGQKKLILALIDLWKLVTVLRKENYSAVVDIKGDPVIILLMLLTGISKRLGFSNGGLGFLLTHSFSLPNNIIKYEANLLLTEALIGDFKDFQRAPRLTISGFSGDSSLRVKKTIVVHLGAGVQARRWPMINWSKLLILLLKNCRVVIIGSSFDSKTLFTIVSELSNLCEDASGLSWEDTAKILQGADLFVGGNSGPAHLAAALGRPVLSIFSAANDPNVWAPPGANVLISKPDCYLCECSYCDKLTCLKEIEPIEVYKEVIKILNN
jgi:ADP-heptose:LPS heptosyltransferase